MEGNAVSESVRMWVEILFNVTYLIVVWGFVIAMWQRRAIPAPDVRPYAHLFMWAFGLLALGDTGHVGFRVWAYTLGGLDTTISIGSLEVGLVGLGALSTAVTVTFFYALMLFIWQRRFNKPLGWPGILLLAAAAIRLIVMVFPQNEWNRSVPLWTWSMFRNIPLLVQGLGVAFLILRDTSESGDRLFRWVGIMVLVSFGFYTPVILLIQRAPVLGMLMIPKTMAYVAIAWLAYANLFAHPARAVAPAQNKQAI
jgi:hypothetical protein